MEFSRRPYCLNPRHLIKTASPHTQPRHLMNKNVFNISSHSNMLSFHVCSKQYSCLGPISILIAHDCVLDTKIMAKYQHWTFLWLEYSTCACHFSCICKH